MMTFDWTIERKNPDHRPIWVRMQLALDDTAWASLADTPVSMLQLSARPRNVLFRESVETVAKALRLSIAQMLVMKGMGVGSVQELCDKCCTWVETRMVPYAHEKTASTTDTDAAGTFPLEQDAQAESDGAVEFMPLRTVAWQQPEVAAYEHSLAEYLGLRAALNDAAFAALPVTSLNLSVRAGNVMEQNDLTTIGAILSLRPATFIGLRNFGVRSADEVIIKLQQRYASWPYRSEESLHAMLEEKAEAACMEVLHDAPFGLTEADLHASRPVLQKQNINVSNILQRLLANGALCKEEGRFVCAAPSVMDYAASLPDEGRRQVLLGRLTGRSLDEIGQDMGLTRERVRQIAKKLLDPDRRPLLAEDRYRDFYLTYAVTAEEASAYPDPIIPRFLALAYSQKRKTERPLSEALTDERLPETFRRRIEQVLHRNELWLQGEWVPRTRPDLCAHIVRTECREDTKMDDFIVMYQVFCEEHDLHGSHFEIDAAATSNRFSTRDDVLWKFHGMFRYYPVSQQDYTALLNGLALEQYENVEISTALLMRKNPELMEQYDIRDPYELHNLLRKIALPEGLNLHLGKMPTLIFGHADREQQVKTLLFELAPISFDDMLAAYDERYGVKSQNLLYDYFSCITRYLHEGMYDVALPVMAQEQVDAMKQQLPGDFYTLEQIKRTYLRMYPGAPTENLTTHAFHRMGFKRFSTYALREQWHDGAQYFRHLLLAQDNFDLKTLPKDIRDMPAFLSIYSDVRRSYDLLEYAPGQCISFSHLSADGVEKEQLIDYCNAVWAATDEGEMFTITSLRERGFSHPLDELGFDDWFYASLLLWDNERFSCQRMSNTRVMIRDKQVRFTRADIVTRIVQQYGAMTLSNLLERLRSPYGIVTDREHLKGRISESTLYYDAITDKVYLDYEKYCAAI